MRGVDITCVGISNWMTSRALESAMFRRTPVVTINNAINCDVFYPVDKNAARKIFSLDLSKKIITIGAQNITDHYKGSLQLFEALRLLSRRGDLHVLAFGKAATTQLKQCGVGFTELGVLRDNLSLRLAYSAGDVFVCASLQEAFGKTVAEAMACGTPAIAFDSTGPADIIVHKTNGYLAEPYSSQSLADGVNWALGAPSGKKINELARAHIINTFSPEVIAKEYVELYESLLRKRGAKISA
jgi:glycosyltransferase involved in cell wall biosynthesis